MYFDETKRAFLEKKTSLNVVLIATKGTKSAGNCNFDLAQYLN
jgi:hypothetical protein